MLWLQGGKATWNKNKRKNKSKARNFWIMMMTKLRRRIEKEGANILPNCNAGKYLSGTTIPSGGAVQRGTWEWICERARAPQIRFRGPERSSLGEKIRDGNGSSHAVSNFGIDAVYEQKEERKRKGGESRIYVLSLRQAGGNILPHYLLTWPTWLQPSSKVTHSEEMRCSALAYELFASPGATSNLLLVSRDIKL
jgi:hypothetical protein